MPIVVPVSDAWRLCLVEGKAMSVSAKIATMPSGKPVLRTDSLEVSNDIKGGQNYFENLQRR